MVVQDNHSDAPLLPIGSVERLHAIRPDRVDWVFEQTQIEADNRRREQSRINIFVFIERIGGILAAMCIGISGIVGGIYVALQGHDWVGVTIATATIGTLAVAFLRRGNVPPPSK